MKKRKPPVGVIGLGIMGGAMAEALLSAGHEVLGYDPAPAARRRLERAGGHALESSLAVAELARAGWTALDCPISGTAARLRDRDWMIFASGERRACVRVRPLLRVFTDRIPYVGAFGSGTRMKFVANHLVAILNVASGEAITLARRMGLDARQVWELFGSNPAVGNGVLRLRGRFM